MSFKLGDHVTTDIGLSGTIVEIVPDFRGPVYQVKLFDGSYDFCLAENITLSNQMDADELYFPIPKIPIPFPSYDQKLEVAELKKELERLKKLEEVYILKKEIKRLTDLLPSHILYPK